MSKFKKILASILSIFKKKESAESLFARRATVSITGIEKITKNLNSEDKIGIDAAKRIIDESRDSFMDFTSTDVENTFNKIDTIIKAIKDSTAERVNFTGGEMKINTLNNAIKTYIKILVFYVNNTIKRNDPRVNSFNIDNVLHAASVAAAIEEIEAMKQDKYEAIQATYGEIEGLERNLYGLAEKMKNDPGLSSHDLDVLENKINICDRGLKQKKLVLESLKDAYHKICNELENAIKYRNMLEEFFGNKSIVDNFVVNKMHEDAEDLSDRLRDSNIENETRRMKFDSYYESSRSPFTKGYAEKGTKLRAEREAAMKSAPATSPSESYRETVNKSDVEI
jgi:hypothetical protein